jgi:uncharacterized protein
MRISKAGRREIARSRVASNQMSTLIFRNYLFSPDANCHPAPGPITLPGRSQHGTMLGTLLNCVCILLGSLAALLTKREIPASRQLLLKLLIGVALVWFGLKIALTGLLSSDWRYFGKLFINLLVSMIAGRVIGKVLRIQAGLNRAGRYAKERLDSTDKNDGLLAATVLFCAAPIGIVGAVEDGLANEIRPLLIKGLIDGLAAFSFARMFGFRIVFAILPVAALQAGIAFGAQSMDPWLRAHGLIDPIHVVAGFLVLYVSLIVFEVKKVELGDYLPALVVAPALALVFG